MLLEADGDIPLSISEPEPLKAARSFWVVDPTTLTPPPGAPQSYATPVVAQQAACPGVTLPDCWTRFGRWLLSLALQIKSL